MKNGKLALSSARYEKKSVRRGERGRKQYAVVNGKDLIAVFFSNEILD